MSSRNSNNNKSSNDSKSNNNNDNFSSRLLILAEDARSRVSESHTLSTIMLCRRAHTLSALKTAAEERSWLLGIVSSKGVGAVVESL